MSRIIPAALFCMLAGWPSAPAFGQLTDPTVGLVYALQSPNLDTRAVALHFFNQLGPEAADAIPRLVEVLRKDEVGDLRFEAARVIGQMGPAARAALPALHAALKDPDPLVHVSAAEAMVKIDPAMADVALLVLVEALRFSRREPAEVPYFFVYKTLRTLGPKGRAAEPVVREGLKERDRMRRLEALATLEAMEADSADLVPLLIAVLQDSHLNGLARVAHQGGTGFVLPLVAGRFDNSRSEFREAIEYLSYLRDLMRLNREHAAILLGKIGPKARAAVPALEAALQEPYLEVRAAARAALEKVQRTP